MKPIKVTLLGMSLPHIVTLSSHHVFPKPRNVFLYNRIWRVCVNFCSVFAEYDPYSLYHIILSTEFISASLCLSCVSLVTKY